MTEPVWLSETEQRSWRAYIDSATLVLEALDRSLQQDAGMPHAYYIILVRLSESADRSMRMSELATATRSSRSRLSHAVSRLTERGWVERVDCETDRRGQIARLTQAGLEALETAAPGHVAAVRHYVIDRLEPEQLSQLEQIGRRIVDGLSPRTKRLPDKPRPNGPGPDGPGPDGPGPDRLGPHERGPSAQSD